MKTPPPVHLSDRYCIVDLLQLIIAPIIHVNATHPPTAFAAPAV